MRSIKLAIDLSPDKASNQIIGITSAMPDEGKTTIAANLAQLLVQSGKKVIVVDCDLRNPSLSASLAPSAATGIVEIINGNQSLEDTIWRESYYQSRLSPGNQARISDQHDRNSFRRSDGQAFRAIAGGL